MGVKAYVDMRVLFHCADISTELLFSPVNFGVIDVDRLDSGPVVLEFPLVFFVDDCLAFRGCQQAALSKYTL